MTITLADIYFLRQAAKKKGADAIPDAVASRLRGAGLIERDARSPCMRITARGTIALTRLG